MLLVRQVRFQLMSPVRPRGSLLDLWEVPQRNQATQTSPSPAHASINLFHRERYHCLCLYYRSGFPSRRLVAERALNQRVIYGAEWEREGFSCLLFWLGSGNSAASSAPKLGNKPDPSVTLPALPHP